MSMLAYYKYTVSINDGLVLEFLVTDTTLGVSLLIPVPCICSHWKTWVNKKMAELIFMLFFHFSRVRLDLFNYLYDALEESKLVLRSLVSESM